MDKVKAGAKGKLHPICHVDAICDLVRNLSLLRFRACRNALNCLPVPLQLFPKMGAHSFKNDRAVRLKSNGRKLFQTVMVGFLQYSDCIRKISIDSPLRICTSINSITTIY
jgi:hypothetical protein